MSMSWQGPLPRDVGVVITAAGRGERMASGTPKQFIPIAGVPLLLHAARPFLSHPDVLLVVVVLPEAVADAPPEWLAALAGDRLRLVVGGAVRMDSVEAGIGALPAACTTVLVHDGARPFPEPAVIDAVIRGARAGTGAIAAIPVSDTLKESDTSSPDLPGRVLRTVPRASLWRAQTPQGFPRQLLEAAFADARSGGFVGTDEASLVERIGGPVALVPDVSTNLKVTTPADLRVAEAIAAASR
jgi:2-C-methyl-D-erythritol 4-phosphate cytidylyltransferase